MNDFFKKLIGRKVESKDNNFALIASTLKVDQVRESEMYVVFNSSDEDKIDTALNTIAIIQYRETPVRKDAVDFMFGKTLALNNVKELNSKSLLLAEESLKYGFKPHSDGLTFFADTTPQNHKELAEIINKLHSVVGVGMEDVVIKSSKNPDFDFRYYSFLDASELENLYDNNVSIDERCIFNIEIRKQYQFIVSEKQKKANVDRQHKKGNDFKI